MNTLTRAAEAYDRKRYEEALRLGRTVADATPGVAAVRELTGLAAYRAERWAMAKIHLRAYFTISEDPEHLPLVMDADRANHRYRAVEKTFEEVLALSLIHICVWRTGRSSPTGSRARCWRRRRCVGSTSAARSSTRPPRTDEFGYDGLAERADAALR